MNKTQLNKQIASLTSELANAQSRAGIIERKLAYLEVEANRLRHDRRPRSNLMLGNNRRAADSLHYQLQATYATVTRSFLELELARNALVYAAPAPAPKPVKPRRVEGPRVGAGLYRMGRIQYGRDLT